MSSEQQLEKIKISLDTLPENEKSVLLGEKIWKKSEKSDFSNMSVDIIESVTPTFHFTLFEEINKPEHSDKKIQFTLKDYLFTYSEQYNTVGRVKVSSNSSAGGGGGKVPSMPLEELFFGLIDECNEKIKLDPKSRWYFVDQYVTELDGVTYCYATLKRNRFIPQQN